MSTLNSDAIRDYLIKVGCKIEYPILVNAFKQYLYNPDPDVQGNIRTQFKNYVNRLATVSLENNMKFIILRPEFRPAISQQVGMDQQVSKQNASVLFPVQQHIHQKQAAATLPPSLHLAQPLQPPPIPQHQRPSETNLQQSLQVTKPAQPLNSIQASTNVAQLGHQPQQRLQNYDGHQQDVAKPAPRLQHQNQVSTLMPPKNDDSRIADVQDGNIMVPPLVTRRSQLFQRPESLNLSSNTLEMPPPRPPPRRRQSTASLFKQTAKPVEKAQDIHELAKKSSGRVKEHALKLNSFTSSSDLNALIPIRAGTMKENRLSRDSTISGSMLQRNGSHVTSRSRSSHREDESDSSSLQPIDPLRRKWAIEACSCNYNGLVSLLREDPKLAYYKDVVNGYTALHWAAKFNNLDIIKLIAGTHGVSANIKSSAGYTPLHVAYMFNRNVAADLLLRCYKANPNVRDHSGRRPMQYWQQPTK